MGMSYHRGKTTSRFDVILEEEGKEDAKGEQKFNIRNNKHLSKYALQTMINEDPTSYKIFSQTADIPFQRASVAQKHIRQGSI